MSSTDNSMRMPLYNGQDSDHFKAIARRAVHLAENGDYMNAKPMFFESLEALEALVMSCHVYYISVLEDFTKTAVEHDDFTPAV